VSPSLHKLSGDDVRGGISTSGMLRALARSTHGKQVLASVGTSGGLFDIAELKEMRRPVLVTASCGIGAKLKFAIQARHYRSLGTDLVNHCLDDILMQGARPLFFTDCVAGGQLPSDMIGEIAGGIVSACHEAGCAFLGGDSVEIPSSFSPDGLDLSGSIVGVVERANILPRRDLCAGDLLVGLGSSGPHTDGYSLISSIFKQVPLEMVFPDLGVSLADALLAPHRSYFPALQHAMPHVKALVHITDGGFIENIPRVLPENLSAQICLGSWEIPPLYQLIQHQGDVSIEEMYRTLNMGIGMMAIVARQDIEPLQIQVGEPSWVIGELVAGEGEVIFVEDPSNDTDEDE
jgi:phosphoribosylformylglycinamidine cyclo-ligase